MNRNVLKATALALVASASLLAPTSQAEAHGRGFYAKSYGYTFYRPVPVYTYVAPKCAEYAWVWKHGYKKLVCVKYW